MINVLFCNIADLKARRAELIARQHNLVSDMMCAVGVAYNARLDREDKDIAYEIRFIDAMLGKGATQFIK